VLAGTARRIHRLLERRAGDDADGRLRLKTPWRDGTTHVLMERSELIERLCR